MEPRPGPRDFLHRRYVRAAAVGLSLALLAISIGALRLRLEHGVSLGAVVRYFTRPHLADGDLTALLRNRDTGRALEALLTSGDTRWLGGMVYADDGRLTFHARAGRGVEGQWRAEWHKRAVYAELVPLYHGGDASRLVGALLRPERRAELLAHGLDPAELEEVASRVAAAADDDERARRLRSVSRFIDVFTPRPLSPSWLGLDERLAFYESPAPRGDYVGQFALLDPGWGGRFDERAALEASRFSHYLLIAQVGDRILLLDFFGGRVCRYDLRPFDHLAGGRLYRLAVAG